MRQEFPAQIAGVPLTGNRPARINVAASVPNFFGARFFQHIQGETHQLELASEVARLS